MVKISSGENNGVPWILYRDDDEECFKWRQKGMSERIFSYDDIRGYQISEEIFCPNCYQDSRDSELSPASLILEDETLDEDGSPIHTCDSCHEEIE